MQAIQDIYADYKLKLCGDEISRMQVSFIVVLAC